MALELLDGENLVWSGRPSWRSMVAFYFGYGILALVPAIAVIVLNAITTDINLGYAILVSAVLLAGVVLVGWIRRIDTFYVVTDRRILIRHGIVSRKERSAHIDRVQNVNTSQTLMQRIFQVGDVDFDTAGTDASESDLRFVGINDPHELRTVIDRAYQASERDRRL